MTEQSRKRFGIRITLPDGDPMAMPHLLGRDWEGYRWYDSAKARDRALVELCREHQFSRRGDRPWIHCTAIDR